MYNNIEHMNLETHNVLDRVVDFVIAGIDVYLFTIIRKIQREKTFTDILKQQLKATEDENRALEHKLRVEKIKSRRLKVHEETCINK